MGTSGEYRHQLLVPSDRRALKELIDQLYYLVNTTLKQTLPAYGCPQRGQRRAELAGAAWGARAPRRRTGRAVRDARGLAAERQLIIGPPALAAACLGLDGWAWPARTRPTWRWCLSQLLFTVQAVGALERRMKAAGSSHAAAGADRGRFGDRQPDYAAARIYSALFGSEGSYRNPFASEWTARGTSSVKVILLQESREPAGRIRFWRSPTGSPGISSCPGSLPARRPARPSIPSKRPRRPSSTART